jgi:hypothetical protein
MDTMHTMPTNKTAEPLPTPDFYPEADFAVPMPAKSTPIQDFNEKTEAACRTIEALNLDTSLDANQNPDPDFAGKARKDAEEALLALAGAMDPVKASQSLAAKNYQPETYIKVKGLLDEYSVRVVDNALQLRLLVTNKLIMQADNPDPKVQLRALELLGKITDVGLFTEKSEVTITHRSTNDLVNNLRSKIQKLMYPMDNVQDAEVVEVNGKAIDVDKELGLDGKAAGGEVFDD